MALGLQTDVAPKPGISPTGTQLPGIRLNVGASVTSFTGISSTTNLIVLEVQGANIYATVDGTVPSSSNGHQMYAGNVYHWNALTARNAQFIQQGSSATIQASQFTVPSSDVQMTQTQVFLPSPLSGVTTGAGNFTSIVDTGTMSVSGTATFLGQIAAPVGIGRSPAASRALIVAGSGTTNADLAASFENGSGTEIFQIYDSGLISIPNGGTLTVSGSITGASGLTISGSTTLGVLVAIGNTVNSTVSLNMGGTVTASTNTYGIDIGTTLTAGANGGNQQFLLIGGAVNTQAFTGQNVYGLNIATPTISGSGTVTGGYMLNVNNPASGMAGALNIASGAVNLGSGTTTVGNLSSTNGFIQNATNEYRIFSTSGDTLTLGANGSAGYFTMATNGNVTLSQNLFVTGTSTLTGNVTVGAGGTGAANSIVTVNGGSGSSSGALLYFQRNSVLKNQIGNDSGINGGTSDGLTLYSGTDSLRLYSAAALALTLDTSQNATFTAKVVSTGQGGVGYAAGAGGTTAQTSSKTTSITFNKITGTITLASGSISSGAIASFTWINSSITGHSVVMFNVVSGEVSAGSYHVYASETVNGSCNVNVKNETTGALNETPLIQFVVINGANS